VIRSLRRRSPVFAACAGLALAVAARTLAAQDGSPEKRAVILVRALSYDANLKLRIGAEMVVAVLARRPGDPCAANMQRGFASLGSAKVAGVPLRTMQLLYTAADALAGAVGQQGIDALYLCPDLEADLGAILEAARKQKVLTMGGTEELVIRGATLGVTFQEARPSLLVNLTSAKSMGAAFSSDLLRVARVIR
jgi:YfiR/HmsC-like